MALPLTYNVRSVRMRWTVALLAMVSGLILLAHFWKFILIGALLAAATFLLLQRVRELGG